MSYFEGINVTWKNKFECRCNIDKRQRNDEHFLIIKEKLIKLKDDIQIVKYTNVLLDPCFHMYISD